MKSKHILSLENKIGDLNNTILSHSRLINTIRCQLDKEKAVNEALRIKYRNPEHMYKELMRARALCGRYYDKYGKLED